MTGDGSNPTADAEIATVSVVGAIAIRTAPDEALVWITLAATEPTAGPALADVARRSEQLVALLDDLAIPPQDRSTTGIAVQEDFDHTQDGRRSLGHRAAASVSVRISDIDLIGRLIMRATEQLDARVAGPRWRVSADNPVWLEAASRAAANARDKAAAYAAGVDTVLGPLLKLAEPDDRIHYGVATAASFHGGGEMPVETGDQEITATVRATFMLRAAVPDPS